MSRVFEKRSSGLAMATDCAQAESSTFDDLTGTAFATGKLSDSSSGGVAVDLNFGHDWVTDGKGNS